MVIALKKRYELTREIFNKCSGNQMRDVFFEEIEADDADIEAIIGRYLQGSDVECDRSVSPDGDIVVDISTDGLLQRLTFCES
ncbi:MAG: hypothetical protein LBJ99_02155 [Oscillospiraceae bacterium]|nr:hypothetical protein [Oscillospiraceae bacterium]